ncbi:MAG: nucleotidyltransferase domain-containing protein [Nanoarchaeota archaeon]|nr:nucleotidyltransferase domain-containing protein [Nanoarchaeota archaeon]
MLNKINILAPFFEDCYRELSIREYSREMKVSPPTASKILKNCSDNGFLLKRDHRGFLFFKVNRENKIMQDLSRIYWGTKLKNLFDFLETYFPKAIVLFGSLSKLEGRKESDVDIALFGVDKKINLEKFEKELKREIHLFFYDSFEKVNKELRPAILNGYLARGYLS